MKFSRLSLALSFLIIPYYGLQADVTLPSFFSEHMVLQKRDKVPVWGKAEPGEQITLTLDKVTAKATTDANGKWKAELDLSKEEQGPFEFTIEGKNQIVIPDVVIGEVWIAAGQSNMVMNLQDTLGGPEEAAQSENPLLRTFSAKHHGAVTPQDNCEGEWSVASPKTSGGFSAVAYYFGKSIQKEMKVPVGMIHTSLWSTSAEAWTSSEALDQDPTSKAMKDKLLGEWGTLPKRVADYKAAFSAWATKYERADHPPADPAAFAGPTISTADWKPVTLPGTLKDAKLPDTGAIWLRKTYTIKPEEAAKDYRMNLGDVQYGTVYWNGVKVEEFAPDSPVKRVVPWEGPWLFKIPRDQIKAGDNVLAIRLYSPAGGAGLTFEAVKHPALAGEWLTKPEYELPALTPEALAAYPGMAPFQVFDETMIPAYTYNGELAPFIPYAIQGVVWYQGEADTHAAERYNMLLTMLIKDWRSRWGYDFAFDFLQLPNSGPKKTEPGESTWANLREAQTKTLSVPNTGMAVSLDTADANLHPHNKKDPGERLGLVALAKTYGKKVVYSGPVFESVKIEGDKVKVLFTHTDGGLVAKKLPATYPLSYGSTSPDSAVTAPLVLPIPDSPVQGFTICGEDKVWKWAHAKIEDDSVIVWEPGVDKPVAIRYAWADNPICNLYNGAGLPAGPFRTDDEVLKRK